MARHQHDLRLSAGSATPEPESRGLIGRKGRKLMPVALRVSAGTFVRPTVPSVPLLITQRATMRVVAALGCGLAALRLFAAKDSPRNAAILHTARILLGLCSFRPRTGRRQV